jgi:uncharacterized protein YbjT (DUF2867 family)
MILVTGATGNTGSEVVHALGRRGANVRAFVRDPEKARARLGEAVELAVGDFADSASLGAALDGIEQLVLSCADDPRRVEWETAAIDAAAAAGVRQIVRLSTTTARPGAPVAFWDWHGRVDEYLRRSGAPFAILRSSFYMSNLFADAEQVAGHGRIVAPAGSARIAMIDPRDVGEAAASVLTGRGNAGRTYDLTGPESITYETVAAELAAATGRPVEFVDVPPEAARAGMIEAGLPEFVADQVVAIFEQLGRGVAATVTGTVESLTGKPPRSFGEFAREHAGVFAQGGIVAAAT